MDHFSISALSASSFLHLLYTYSPCFVVKPFLQDIFTESDWLLKGLDSVPVQHFIGLTVGNMLHLLYLVVWHYTFHHYDTLLPLLFLLPLGHHHTEVLEKCLSYEFSGQMTKLPAAKASVLIPTGWPRWNSRPPGRKLGWTSKSGLPAVTSIAVIVLPVIGMS